MTMASAPGEAPGAATTPHSAVAAHELRRQASMPAVLASAFAPCGGGSASRATVVCWDGDDAGFRRGRAPRRPAQGAGGAGVGAVVRALWAWVARGGRKAAVVMSRSRSGSSSSSSGASAKEQRQQQYGHEEYAQNFDEGGAAREPENLSRSFSARYASARRGGAAR